MKHGRFVWYDLLTLDKPGAQRFYESVVGWRFESANMAGIDYSILVAGESRIGGAMPLSDDARAAGARPGWIGTVAVADVDATARQAASAGGAILRPAEDIPGQGRFAVLADPQGAAFQIYSLGAVMGEAHQPGVAGMGGWHELYTDDPEAAFAFYSGLFGWEKDQAMDMGPMGVYQIFALGGAMIGGIMRRPEQIPASFWNYYFGVDSAAAAAERVRNAGGQVLMGPQQVPGGSWIVQGLDPQGVMFSLTSEAA